MSNETYSEIRKTLTSLGAPLGPTISDRIRGLCKTLVEHMTRAEQRAAILDSQRAAAERRAEAAEEALGAERHRADVAEHDARIATTAFGEMAADLASQRADVATLRAKLDYATELLTKRGAS